MFCAQSDYRDIAIELQLLATIFQQLYHTTYFMILIFSKMPKLELDFFGVHINCKPEAYC